MSPVVGMVVVLLAGMEWNESIKKHKQSPCLDHLKIPSFFTLSPSHQFLAAYMEY
jgi:hypothetical protein